MSAESKPLPDHPKDDLTPREMSQAAHMNRHLMLRHQIGGLSDVWTYNDLHAFHDGLHAPPPQASDLAPADA